MINKMNVLDDHGLDEFYEDVFQTVDDHYVRRSSNPVSRVTFVVKSDGCLYAILDEETDPYGFELRLDESEPSEMIKYIGKNTGYKPAHMDYEHDRFDYGDWSDAWFISGLKPCMIRYDGRVDYELNPNDYTKKKNGAASAITDINYQGNVMVGLPTVWIKVDTSRPNRPRFWFADYQRDQSYHAYAHTNTNGDVTDYIYLAAYEGWQDSSNRLRSISGQFPTETKSMTTYRSYARNNNPEGASIWDMTSLSDRELITLLLILIGKSTNSQDVFGNGNSHGQFLVNNDTTHRNTIMTGTTNTKGLFWGDRSVSSPVKVFGIEHFWGNTSKFIQGLVADGTSLKYKLTRGRQDGSTTNDYNTTGAGYITAGRITTLSNQYISSVFTGAYGILPSTSDTTGTSRTYFCDKLNTYINTNPVVARFGGGANEDPIPDIGPFRCELDTTSSSTTSNSSSAITCKPTQ